VVLLVAYPGSRGIIDRRPSAHDGVDCAIKEVEMSADLEAARLITYRSAWLSDTEGPTAETTARNSGPSSDGSADHSSTFDLICRSQGLERTIAVDPVDELGPVAN
jgi:hypothetical protein